MNKLSIAILAIVFVSAFSLASCRGPKPPPLPPPSDVIEQDPVEDPDAELPTEDGLQPTKFLDREDGSEEIPAETPDDVPAESLDESPEDGGTSESEPVEGQDT